VKPEIGQQLLDEQTAMENEIRELMDSHSSSHSTQLSELDVAGHSLGLEAIDASDRLRILALANETGRSFRGTFQNLVRDALAQAEQRNK